MPDSDLSQIYNYPCQPKPDADDSPAWARQPQSYHETTRDYRHEDAQPEQPMDEVTRQRLMAEASRGTTIEERPHGLVIGDSMSPPQIARVNDPSIPQSLSDRLQVLHPWQARYVLALMELGGNMALACQRCSVSRASVNAALASPNSEFSMACHDALDHSTDLMEAAIYRGGSIGDTQPVYQKGLIVGYKRVRNTKDAELLMRLRGRLTENGDLASRTARPAAAASAVPEIVAATLATLFAVRAAQQAVSK